MTAIIREGNLADSEQAVPDLLEGMFGNIREPLAQLNGVLAKVFDELSCPPLESIDTSQLDGLPGSSGTYSRRRTGMNS